MNHSLFFFVLYTSNTTPVLTHHPQVAQKIREATPEEKVAQLEEIRATLVTKQRAIQRKIDEVERRRQGMTREESMMGQERRRER